MGNLQQRNRETLTIPWVLRETPLTIKNRGKTLSVLKVSRSALGKRGNQCISARRCAHHLFALKPCENHDSCVSLDRAQAPHAAKKQEKLINPMVPASMTSGSKGGNLDTFGMQGNHW